MPRVSPEARCVYCTRSQDECGPLSYRHICRDCAEARMIENIRQQETKQGALYRRKLLRELVTRQNELAATEPSL